MKQLGGLDSVFVHAEQRGLPMHISSFSIYDPSTATFSDSTDGSADKQQVQLMVRTLLDLQETPRPDDAADGLAVAITHYQYQRLASLL